jgi:membrane fusion protein (multidrug efflux system)
VRHRTPSGIPALAAAAIAALLTPLAGCDEPQASTWEAEQPPAEDSPLRSAVRVRVATVVEECVERSGTVSGVVNAFHRATIAAETTGRVVTRHVEPGDVVDAGQVLIELDATRLRLAVEQAGARLRRREIDLAEARRELERADRLVGDDAISKSRHDAQRFAVDRAASAEKLARVALRTAQRNLADAKVRAPFAGSVEEVRVDVGDLVSPGTPLATLVDLSRARIHAGVTSIEAAGLTPGTRAPVVLAELGGTAVEAEIHSVGRIADPASGTYTLELWLDSPDGLLREGMVAQVRLPVEPGRRNPVVPRAALIRSETGTAVFVVDRAGGEPRAVARPVRIGRSNAEKIEVLKGVTVGEEVVIDGLFALRDGAPVLVEKTSTVGAPSDG